MGRLGALALGVALLGFACDASAAPVNLLISGGTIFLIFDADDDGPDASDCTFSVTFDPTNGAIVLTPLQGTTPLQMCSGNSSGTASVGQDSSSDFADVQLGTTNTGSSSAAHTGIGALGLVPGTIELIAETFSGPPNGLPLEVNEAEFFDGSGNQRAFLQLCTAGGPSARVQFPNGISVLLPISLYPDAQNPTHLEIAGLSLERASPNLGSSISANAFIPMSNGHITIARQDTPNDLLVDFSPSGLPPCSARGEAPTLSEWGVAATLGLLLGIGVWSLRRSASVRGTLRRL